MAHLILALLGYAMFYFVRKNIGVAAPEMYGTLGITKNHFGLFLTLHGVLYGVSKFVNGFLGDRFNARWFMPFGLVCCAIVNILFGLSSSRFTLGALWMINGWFQGIGFPPCARLMTHWFSPREFATKMAIWNSSHSLGAGLIFILCGYLAPVNWRLCFFVPAGIVLVAAVALLIFLRDTPESLGFPPVEGTADERHDTEPMSGARGGLCLPTRIFGSSRSPTSSFIRCDTGSWTGRRRSCAMPEESISKAPCG